jgi:hypothetical protein
VYDNDSLTFAWPSKEKETEIEIIEKVVINDQVIPAYKMIIKNCHLKAALPIHGCKELVVRGVRMAVRYLLGQFQVRVRRSFRLRCIGHGGLRPVLTAV